MFISLSFAFPVICKLFKKLFISYSCPHSPSIACKLIEDINHVLFKTMSEWVWVFFVCVYVFGKVPQST